MTRFTMEPKQLCLALYVVLSLHVNSITCPPPPLHAKSVLFIVVDDLRPEFGPYLAADDTRAPLHPKVVTPNLDKLASRSLVLKRAYAQQALGSPSRSSFLTGRRPDTTHVYDKKTYFRIVGGNYTTIPEYFLINGYYSNGIGKLFYPGKLASNFDDPISWTDGQLPKNYHAPNQGYWSSKNNSWLSVPPDSAADKPLPDQQIAAHAVSVIKDLSTAASVGLMPFFIGVGFHKPHLPFVVPHKYLDLYPLQNISLPDNPYAPIDMPKSAWYDYEELREYDDIQRLNVTGNINTTLPKDVVLNLRRAYYASISYIDDLIGEILAELQTRDMADKTIVVVVGDHGFQLGEHGEWAKQTNFDVATHVPLMISIPGITDNGTTSDALTELVDIFPTVAEAAGTPKVPLCPENNFNVKLCAEGMSLIPLITNASTAWKDAVFSQYPRTDTEMGYSMLTDAYRYTEWVEFSGYPQYKPNWSNNFGTELYDHQTDASENVNVVDDAKYASVVKQLSDRLHAGWRKAMP